MNTNYIIDELSKFSSTLSGDSFKYLSISTNFDLNTYIIYYTLKDTDAVINRRSFRRACTETKIPLENYNGYANYFKEIVHDNLTNSNLSKLDSIIDFENSFNNTLHKELDIIFKDFPLLSYRILLRPILKNKNSFSFRDFVSTLDLKNRRIVATLRVLPKDTSYRSKESNFIDCTLYIECI